MNVLVSGSLSYDRIMDFEDRFHNHILPEKIHILNISFTVKSLKETFGGNAGNICYNLRLLGITGTPIGSVGKNFSPYREWLEKNRINTEKIYESDTEFTASAHVMNDLDNNQITAFHPGAMSVTQQFKFSTEELRDTWAILSPGNIEEMKQLVKLYQKNSTPFIFDPGQITPLLTGDELLTMCEGAQVLIANDYEWQLISGKTGLKEPEQLLPRVGVVIITLGQEGSIIHTKNGKIEIPAVPPTAIIDPTGAGDAYRAGLIKGLIEKKPWDQIGALAATAASFPIEHRGCQEHIFTPEQFDERLKKNFNNIKNHA